MKVIAGPMDEVETKVPWMEQAPAHWEFRRAKFLFRKMNRPVREDDEIVTAFRDGTVTLRSNRRTEGFTNAVQEIGYQGVRRGDLVIHAMVRAVTERLVFWR